MTENLNLAQARPSMWGKGEQEMIFPSLLCPTRRRSEQEEQEG